MRPDTTEAKWSVVQRSEAEGVRLQLARELPVASAEQRSVVRLSERPVANAMSVL